MKLKKLRFWLASKILGGAIIQDTETLLREAQHEWIKRQLDLGNEVTLEYSVTPVTPIKKARKKRDMPELPITGGNSL